MKLHTGVLPFECPIVGCTSKFSRRDNMKEVLLIDLLLNIIGYDC